MNRCEHTFLLHSEAWSKLSSTFLCSLELEDSMDANVSTPPTGEMETKTQKVSQGTQYGEKFGFPILKSKEQTFW